MAFQDQVAPLHRSALHLCNGKSLLRQLGACQEHKAITTYANYKTVCAGTTSSCTGRPGKVG